MTAARVFQYLAEHYKNELWMKTMAARAYFEAGDHTEAGRLSHEVNRERPTVDTLLLEAKISRERGDVDAALRLLARAEQRLDSGLYPAAHLERNLCST